MRRAKRIDSNQPEIVKTLKQIPGVTVALDHDDILVGYKGSTYWFECKSPDQLGKDGKVRPSALKESQKKLLATWTGHYRVVTAVDEIIDEILQS